MRAGITTMLFSKEMIKMEWQDLQVCGECLISRACILYTSTVGNDAKFEDITEMPIDV